MMTDVSVKELSSELQAAIEQLKNEQGLEEVGVVTRIGDGVAWVYGLTHAGFNEVITIEGTDGTTIEAFALNLMEDEIGAVLLGADSQVSAGARAKLSGKVVEVPVGPELLGRVVDPLGRPLDGAGPIKTKQTGLIERTAPGVMDRKSVHEPLMTGIMAIDAMIPIGRGQRELIIGDRQTGKTAIGVDTIINQKGQGVYCFYVAIGQKRSTVEQVVKVLTREGAMDYTTVVVASASEPAPLQFIAPYSGCSMGEYFRDSG